MEGIDLQVKRPQMKFLKGRPLVVPDLSLPLYTPHTKKMSWEDVEELMEKGGIDEGTRGEVKKWLSDKKFYEDLLRDIPIANRQRWKNKTGVEDANKILKAGIIEKVADESSSKCFVKLSSTNEEVKARRRLLLETREINNGIRGKEGDKKVLRSIVLPTQKDIEQCASSFSHVDCFDFRSFYYQILLHEEIRAFFRIYINGECYQLRVLPMGACFSVFVAQVIAQATANVLESRFREQRGKTLVYIDNLFFFHNHQREIQRAIDEPFIPEIGERALNVTETRILGRMVNLEEKEVRLTTDTCEKIREARLNKSPPTLRKFLSVWGLIIFASSTLHIPLSNFSDELRRLSFFCRKFLKGEIALEEPVLRPGLERLLALEWGETVVKIPLLEELESHGCVVFSDASNQKGAHVVIGLNVLIIHSYPFPDDVTHINEKEAFAAAKGVEHASRVCKGQRITWITDSRVVFHAAHRGRSKNGKINEAIREINDVNEWVQAVWTPSEKNLADAPTRGKEMDMEMVEEQREGLKGGRGEKINAFWEENLAFGKKWRRGGVPPLKS